MAPRASKQADRGSKKVKQEDEPASAADAGDFVDVVKGLVLGSCIAQTAPKMPDLMQDKLVDKNAPKEEPEKKEESEETDKNAPEETKAEEEEEGPTKIFSSLCDRLAWHNVLGLGSPASAEESKKAWLSLKGLELDFGPRAKRNGSPGTDRIKANLRNNLPQYLHALLALMMLSNFLFRSWFACLPWLVGYQVLSTMLPVTNIPQVPQVELEKVPIKFRVAATVGLHGLVWFFFLYEVLWRSMFLTIPLAGGLVYHAYAVRPVGQ